MLSTSIDCEASHPALLLSFLSPLSSASARRTVLPSLPFPSYPSPTMDSHDIFLILVVVIMSLLLLFGMCLAIVIFGHEDDKNVAWFPKIVTVFGLWLAFASVLVLPYDVAAATGASTQIRVDLVWQIVYIVLAVMICFIIPFAFFYYENDLDDDEKPASWFDSQSGMAFKYTLALAAVFLIVLGIMYAFLNTAHVPVVSYSVSANAYTTGDGRHIPSWVMNLDDSVAASTPSILPGQPDACTLDKAGDRCTTAKIDWKIPVSFPLFLIAFMAFLGWFFFVIFVGVGFFALPMDLIQEYTTRPTPMTTKTYFDERGMLGQRAKQLINIAQQLQIAMEKHHTGSQKRQEQRDLRNLEKHYFYLKKDYQILTIAYKLRGGNPLVYLLKLFGGIIFGGISLSWWLHICIFILPAKPADPFLNTLFVTLTDKVPSFPLFGVLAFALWSFHLLFCVVKGNFRLGVRFLFIKLYPMEIGNTLMNAFLFNTWIILLTAVPAVQFCVEAFPIYTSDTQASIMFGTQIKYLEFFRYFFLNNVFIIALLCISALTVLFLIICPRNKADDVERTLDRIAKSSNTKTGLKEAMEDDD